MRNTSIWIFHRICAPKTFYFIVCIAVLSFGSDTNSLFLSSTKSTTTLDIITNYVLPLGLPFQFYGKTCLVKLLPDLYIGLTVRSRACLRYLGASSLQRLGLACSAVQIDCLILVATQCHTTCHITSVNPRSVQALVVKTFMSDMIVCLFLT